MTKPFDPTKPVQTRDGRKARIICTDMQSDHPIVALIKAELCPERMQIYFRDGLCFAHRESADDLINIPERKSQWFNVYHSAQWYYSSKNGAQEAATIDCAGQIEIIFEDGKPVDVKLHKDEK